MIKEIPIFINESLRSFKTTGSVCPTSRWAAKQMISPLTNRTSNQGLRILELGPGTGSVTKWILRAMNFNDTLSICEINSRFMQSLKKNLEKDSYYQTHKSRIDFFGCPMQKLESSDKYDLIICAIPFLNLDSSLISEIFNKISQLGHDKTLMTYYEYIGLRQLGKKFTTGSNRLRMKNIDDNLNAIVQTCSTQRSVVWCNFTPVIVFTLSNLPNLSQLIKSFAIPTESVQASFSV